MVAPRGDVDIASASAVQAALEARAGNDETLVLDLRAVEFLDTSGLRLVVEFSRRARDGGYRFAVVRGSERVHRIFQIAGIDDAEVDFVDDPAEVLGGRDERG